MLEEIMKKIDVELSCELSTEELKVLYGIDSGLNSNKINYSKKRDNYEDLSKIFGNKNVAHTLSEINENTICYVGDLDIDSILPTYNLRYVYGDLDYRLDKVYNLENLEIISGDAKFESLTSAEGLESLRAVGGYVTFNLLTSAEGLENLETIGYNAHFESLISAKGLEKLKAIYGVAYFESLKSAKGLENLETIYKAAHFESLKTAEGLEGLKYIGDHAYFESLINAEGLENLQTIVGNVYIESSCELSIKELKVLYGVDNEISLDKIMYISGRNKYTDFIKLFGNDAVARVPEEITENTICYIGNLNIDSILPTHNLRYVYGDLDYRLDKVYNLENLQYVIGTINFNFIKSAKGLESLEYIHGSTNFFSLMSIEGLNNLRYPGTGGFIGSKPYTPLEIKDILSKSSKQK